MSDDPEKAHLESILVLREGAAMLFGLYESYLEAGFTSPQAMQLLCALVGAAS